MTILHTTVKIGHIMITLCWQVCRHIRETTVVAVSKGCHDAGLRKQHLAYHDSWDGWHLKLLVWFWVLQCGDVGSAY